MNVARHTAFALIRRFMAFVASDTDAQMAVRSLIGSVTAEATTPDRSIEVVSDAISEVSLNADVISTPAMVGVEALPLDPQIVDETAACCESVELKQCSDELLAESEGQVSPFAHLAGFAIRLRAKAEGCRWTKKRSILRQNGANHQSEIAPTDLAIIDKARRVGCLLWMNSPHFRPPEDLAELDVLAEWFDVTAEVCEVAAMLTGEAHDARAFTHDLLPLLAESQSGLRFAVSSIAERIDPDQTDLHHAVRQCCTEQCIYLDRFLKADDAPEVSAVSDLGERIQHLRMRIEERLKHVAKRRKLFGKLRHQLRPEQQQRDPTGYWPSIASTVDQLVGLGVPPSSLDLRRLLQPVLGQAPENEGLPKRFQLCLRELRMANRPLRTLPCSSDKPAITPAVKRLRRLLAGRKAVLTGGDYRPLRQARIERAFRLSELIWVSTKPGDSPAKCEPSISQPEVVVVLLAIRWVSHGHADIIKYCTKYGKPLVRIPARYGINQIAEQTLSQCSGKLNRQRRDHAAKEQLPVRSSQ